MPNIHSYLSENFLQEFVIDQRPNSLLSPNFAAWINLYSFLSDLEKTSVVISGSKEKYTKDLLKDPLVFSLINSYYEGNQYIKFKNWEDEINLLASSFQYFFLHSTNESLANQLKSKGLPSFLPSDAETLQRIIGYEAIHICKNLQYNKLNNWADLSQKLLPFHSIVVVDNYLFGSYKPLAVLLEEILPISVSHSSKINLTLIGSDFKDKQGNYPSTKIERQLRNSVSENITYSSVILKDTGQFHDRLIFTNSQFLTSGNSFSNYFDVDAKGASIVKLKSPTILNLYSYACTHNNSLWVDIATQMLQALKNLIKKLPAENITGKPLENSLIKFA